MLKSGEDSRNYTFGKRLASGDSPDYIFKTSSEVIEGVDTLKIIHRLATKEKLQLPITTMLYKVIFEGYEIRKAIKLLMTYNYAADVDFI